MGSELLCDVISISNRVFGKKLHALVFSGSYSRGEQTILVHNNKKWIAGDLEFTIFQANYSWLFRRGHLEFEKAINDLVKVNNLKVDYDIKPIAFSSFIPRTLFWFETLAAEKIYGGLKNKIEKKIESYSVDMSDLFEVLNHSAIAIMKSFLSHDLGETISVYKFKYQILKSTLDLFVPLLAAEEEVIPFHVNRYKKVIELGLLGDLEGEYKDVLEVIYKAKISGEEHEVSMFDDLSIHDCLNFYLLLNKRCQQNIQSKGFVMGKRFKGNRSIPRLLFAIKNKLFQILNVKKNNLSLSSGELIHINFDTIKLLKDIIGRDSIFDNLKFIEERYELNKQIYRYL